MTRDFFVKFCSKNCPSVACKHAQIPGGDALTLTYNYDKFFNSYWNFDLAHKHRVRNVLLALRACIALLNAEKVHPTPHTNDIGGYLFALMEFERIMASNFCFAKAFYAGSDVLSSYKIIISYFVL